MKNIDSISSCLLIAAFLKHALAFPTTHIEETDLIEKRLGLPEDGCPNYQYKCPDCPPGTQCIYPNSGGCDGAGIPICQALNCHGIVCLLRTLPCPEECPYSCTYGGPGCCPFIGEPICKEPCETFAPCEETPCPDDCPDDCFYPDADYCCPKSGEPICRHGGRRLDSYAALPDKSDLKPSPSVSRPLPSVSRLPSGSLSVITPSHDQNMVKRQDKIIALPSPSSSSERRDESRWFYQPIGKQLPESGSWFIQDFPGKTVSTLGKPTATSAPLELVLPNATPTPYGSNWFYQPSGSALVPPAPSSWLYQPTPKEECPPCPPLPTPTWGICTVHHDDRECCPYITCVGEPVSAEPASPEINAALGAKQQEEHEEEHVFCADYIIPCPPECPRSCKYPKNVNCPYQYQPVCPPYVPLVVTTTVTSPGHAAHHTPAPPAALPPSRSHVPALDRPLESVSKILSSLLHVQMPTASRPVANQVAPKPASDVATAAAPPPPPPPPLPAACPRIMYMCPSECPKSCIRPDIPCPYSVVPVCPDGADEEEYRRFMDDEVDFIDALEPHPIDQSGAEYFY